jgi:predicted  nucleic acid-binding Zn-ribbon protein
MKIIEQLLKLQELELGPAAKAPATRRELTALRADVPPQVLGHYDRLVARGKKAVALVRRSVCSGCQMQLPSGLYAKLLRDDDICLCENCARYLKVAPAETAVDTLLPTATPKRAPRRRRPAPVAEAVAA